MGLACIFGHDLSCTVIDGPPSMTTVQVLCRRCRWGRVFAGRSTVWHDVRTGERAGTMMEVWLSGQAFLREYHKEPQP